MSLPLFELEKVSYRYKGIFTALLQVDLTIQEGERVAILGATRSGKTTLLKILQGRLIAEEGRVRVLGEPRALVRERRLGHLQARIGFLSQHPDGELFRPTVLDELIYGSGIVDVPSAIREAYVHKICDALGIKDLLDRSPNELSGGEKKMVGIAAALIGRPDVLMLDEPTPGLSDCVKGRIVWLLTRSIFTPGTLFLSTHDLSLAEALCDRAVLLSPDHRKVADGPIQKILQDTGLLLSTQVIHEHGHRHGGSFHLHRHDHGEEHGHEH
jgi:cobalt/nickel transport system ATP-binding protein